MITLALRPGGADGRDQASGTLDFPAMRRSVAWIAAPRPR